MAKVTMPLMSGGATGSFANTITFTPKFGRYYVGKKILTNTSNTSKQAAIRLIAKHAAAAWNSLPSATKLQWKGAETRPGVSGYARFLDKSVVLNYVNGVYDGTFATPSVA